MKLILGTLFLITCLVVFLQPSEITGTYFSINNKFERWSNITLKANQTFSYSYGVSGCQGTITGTFIVDGSTLKFTNDPEFLNNLSSERISIDSIEIDIPTPFYPNLGLSNWKIGRNFIRPIKPVYSGCLKVMEKHRRK